MGKITAEIDKCLLKDAMKAVGANTKRDAIEAGLKALVRRQNREALRRALGTLDMDLTVGDLERVLRGK